MPSQVARSTWEEEVSFEYRVEVHEDAERSKQYDAENFDAVAR